MGTEAEAARAEVVAAREAFSTELVRLEAAGRAAVDIKAKVKRNPVKAAGLAAGAGFLAIGALVGAILGIVTGLVRRAGVGGTIGAAIALAILGLVVGAVVAIDFSRHVAIAIGLALTLAFWPALVGIDTYRRGIDIEAIKNRFYPRLTVETTKETIEWVRKQRPLGPKS